MTKQDFINALQVKLIGLPKQDTEERLAFYSEMIDDRMEDGLSEEDAVAAIGSIDDVKAQIIADIPISKIAKERMKPKRRLKAWEIVLLALGSPIWLSLAIAAFAVLLALYVVLWSLVVSIWSVFVSLVASSFACIAGGVVLIIFGNTFIGLAAIGAGIVCAGLSIFLFFACKAATKGVILLTKAITLGIKKCFVKKEEV